MSAEKRAKFVLVPGAFHRPGYQEGIRNHLLRHGYDSTVVQLPTAGAVPALTSFEPDVANIMEAIRTIVLSGTDAVVVAHSYGAVPATEAVGRLVLELVPANKNYGRIKMVFVAAYVLLQGQTVASVGTDLYDGKTPPPTPSDIEFTETHCSLNEQAKQDFYGDLPTHIADQLRDALVPQCISSFVSPITQAGWASVPSSYVFTPTDGAISIAFQQFMVNRARIESQKNVLSKSSCEGELGTVTLDCGHFGPYYTKVEELAEYLDKVASDDKFQ